MGRLWVAVLGMAGWCGGVAFAAGVEAVKVLPAAASVAIGEGVEFTATVDGPGVSDRTVTWSVTSGEGSSLSAGTISAKGWYQTPYPAPASVVVTAVSNADGAKVATVRLMLHAPAEAPGPALRVDVGGTRHPISPLIYGMNGYDLKASTAEKIKLPVNRWGGDAATTYNYLLDVTNAGNDWYFETNPNGNTKYPDVSEFNAQVERDRGTKTMSIGTVPLSGRMTKRQTACSFPVAKYGPQQKVEPYKKACGNGVTVDGKELMGSDPEDVSFPIDESFTAGWVKYLVQRIGDAAHGGVAMYELDNEPEFWSGVHKDIHPASLTYDEVTNKGLTYAAVIKAADPTAKVAGPVISFFDNYFYSWADLKSGWEHSACHCYNGNPIDRMAHGDVPLLEYYLQQFKGFEAAHGIRLLDYLDLHGYFATKDANFASAGDTAAQAARLESTRSMWDASFTDSGQTEPEVRSREAKPVAVRLIPRMREWVAKDYPGTKTAITEYNWGAQEHINGALAQVDLLGIFGREGLDLATLWGPPDPVKQLPGLIAYEMYRNYDGKGSEFGDWSLTASSGDQGKLAVYGAMRQSDGALTVMVINKSFGALKSALSVAGRPGNAKARVYVYSNENLGAIVEQPQVAMREGRLSRTYPAASVTLLVIPKP